MSQIYHTDEIRAAVLMARAACLNAEIAGMVAENQQRVHQGQSMAYGEDNFTAAIERNMLGESAITQVIIHGELR